jgi:hypothetical protein
MQKRPREMASSLFLLNSEYLADARLKPSSNTNVPASQVILGRVVDAAHKPVSKEDMRLEFRVNPLGNRLWFHLPGSQTAGAGN